ncbi:MAG: Eco57I restriction-modification methylase domain-containing protein [Alphaproteobacteria bacterium]|nr:Eco57I restriction-modification methylase domain-containing protein [Alphaproteobacteria bacterium]
MTKRSLYTCNDKFADIDNIFFDERLGRYVKDKDGIETEKQCFHFIENQAEISNFFETKGIKDMRFDVIIGNPPYQENDGGGTGDSARPIYQKFIQQAKLLLPQFICMIVPSRWMKGGKGLDSFREEMINDTRISHIVDYANASECFTLIHLDGGVCYFLWDFKHNEKLQYTYKALDGDTFTTERYLKTDVSDTVIRDIRQLSIIQKVASLKENKFNQIVSARKPYGLGADFFNFPDRYPNVPQITNEGTGLLKVYGVKGKKGGARRTTCFVKKEFIIKNIKSFDKYKLFFSKAYMATSTVPPKIILGKPSEICTETFLEIGPFNTQKEAQNCLKYIETKFCRALLFYNRHSLNISQDSFLLIPLPDFTKSWTDKELYNKYQLTPQEIEFIEQQILPMDNETTTDIDTDNE